MQQHTARPNPPPPPSSQHARNQTHCPTHEHTRTNAAAEQQQQKHQTKQSNDTIHSLFVRGSYLQQCIWIVCIYIISDGEIQNNKQMTVSGRVGFSLLALYIGS
jgi:hypothetical protein